MWAWPLRRQELLDGIAIAAGQVSVVVLPVLFENQTKDFGKVMEGTSLKHVFKFSNNGEAVLEIFKVEGS